MLNITDPFEWTEMRRYHNADGSVSKIIEGRIEQGPYGDELVIRELWFEENLKDVAAMQRDLNSHKDAKPLAVVPKGVQAQAINEGWINDRQQWKKWLNDADNKYLRVTDGVA